MITVTDELLDIFSYHLVHLTAYSNENTKLMMMMMMIMMTMMMIIHYIEKCFILKTAAFPFASLSASMTYQKRKTIVLMTDKNLICTVI